MNIGDVVRMSNFKAQMRYKGDKSPGISSMGYKAPSGTYFVFVLLGVEASDGSEKLDPDSALRRMGWSYKPLGRER